MFLFARSIMAVLAGIVTAAAVVVIDLISRL
jgi:hypothetical protein